MTQTKMVRIPKVQLEAAERLLEAFAAHSRYGVMGRVSVTAVVRAALQKGLDALEEELVTGRQATDEP